MSEINATPLPQPDRDSEPFWRALKARTLQLQRCTACDTLRWPPRAICNRCSGFDCDWQQLSGRGVLVSWIRTHQVFAPAYRDKVPYVVVQVALAEQEDILLIGGWRGDRDPVAGEAVEACFVRANDEVGLLDWTPSE